ncbi:MAG: GNAT family N-acetyltransferase [Desulfobacterales bacterium]|nr:GNAT family N-acetyltransferase [Desulfobacterales bacterium]
MTTLNLDKILSPGHVAVIGASEKPGSVGATVMGNLTGGGFTGRVFPVNPGYETVMGLKAFGSVEEIDDEVDMAVIAVSMAGVPRVLEGCGRKGVAGAVVISADFGRAGVPDGTIRDAMAGVAARTGIRIIGPDSVGLVNTGLGLNAGFMHQLPLPGKIAFLSQSGAVCTAVLDLAVREHVGFSHFVSLGSNLDVDFADMIDYLGSLDEVDSIVMVVESLTRVRKFMSAARAVSRVKPVIALKTGRGRPGSEVCEDEIYDAMFKRAGILRVREFEALFDCAEFLGKQKRPRGPRLGIVSNAGGIGGMAADVLKDNNIEPAVLSPGTRAALDKLLRERWRRVNPVEVLQESSADTYISVVRTLMDAEEIDGLLLLSSPVGTYDAASIAGSLAGVLKKAPFPVITAWMGGLNSDRARAIFNREGIITYETPERAVKAFINLYQYGKNIELLQEIPYRTDKRLDIDYPGAARIMEEGLVLEDGIMSPGASADLLSAYGIRMDDDGPIEAGDYSLRISVRHHDLFGPVIRFGTGGLMTEIARDQAMTLPPLNRLLARRAMEASRISRVFSGRGTIAPLDTALLEEMLIRTSRLVTDFPQIRSIDMNPILVRKGRIFMARSRIRVAKTGIKAPAHLIVSPYPWWQESKFTTRDGDRVFMRPIRPADADQVIDMFERLSPETVYRRFFSPLKEISRPLLIKLTQIDYDREIALTAFSGEGGNRSLVGVARIIFQPSHMTGEFAILLADDWQSKGIGRVLLTRALESARAYGLKTVYGPVISTNTAMLALGKKLGFTVARDPDTSEYKLTIRLRDL